MFNMDCCPICLDQPNTYMTECGHGYCIHCLCRLKKCAVCRKELIKSALCKEISLNYLKKLQLAMIPKMQNLVMQKPSMQDFTMGMIRTMIGMGGLAYSN
jgi:hypothetical protein